MAFLGIFQLGQSGTMVLRSASGQGTSRWTVFNTRLALQREAFWGSRLRGADIDFLSLDLQLKDSQEGFDNFELKTRHVGCEH